MQREKVRIFALARELNLESKEVLALCRQAGIDVKNQLSTLDPDQRDAIELLVKRGGGTAVAAPPKPATVVLPTVQPGRVRVLDSRRAPPKPAEPAASKAVETPPGPAPAAPPPSPSPPSSTERPAAAISPPPTPSPAAAAPAAGVSSPPQPVPSAGESKPAGTAPEAAKIEPAPSPARPVGPVSPVTSTPAASMPTELTPRIPPVLGGRVRDLNQGRSEGGQRPRRREPPRPLVARVVSRAVTKPATPESKKPEGPVQKPIQRLGSEALRTGIVNPTELLKGAGLLTEPVKVPSDLLDEEEAEGKKGVKRGPGQVTGRDRRHQQRSQRAEQRKKNLSDVLTLEEERPQKVRRTLKVKQKLRGPTQPRKGKIPIQLPITVRSLSEAIGLRTSDLLKRLLEHGAPMTININSTIEPELAEVIALDIGCELEIKRPQDAEEALLADLKQQGDPNAVQPRGPIVTIMGHVDHGKTSLLDRIRKSNVAASEAGGITQVIRAWRVEHHGKPITFLDTPGHEAFTKMRARGANVTDIAVIVVAADDGVMPQTEEAISHAKAAGVPIVVAINKVDLPNANVNKTRQQLYGLELVPDNMGGDVPFIETSAATGKGIDELLETLSLVAELRELKANPTRPGSGTCLEAMLSEGEGVLATLLVQDGTLHRGDVVLCGAAYGRVRALYNDLGQPIAEAGPSVPVRMTGLDLVPNADDPFQVVPDLALAREIAEKRRNRLQEASLMQRAPVRLESLSEAKIAELKVILKADFRGSIEAIRKELEKLQHEEVRVRVLHAGIGAITESDVQLALTSPQDTIIVGFNVVPDERARTLAEERGVQLRQYNIIYNLTDDIKAALQGKLKPREEIVHLGRAVVRETFKISRVGTIAGCFVTSGIIERSAKVRVIRDGVVVYPPPDRTAGLESLKRFRDDVREVREGFECGLKIAGYDDVKVGDAIEAYRVEQIQRTL